MDIAIDLDSGISQAYVSSSAPGGMILFVS